MSKLDYTRHAPRISAGLGSALRRWLLGKPQLRFALRLVVHLFLFAITVITCTVFGWALVQSFSANQGLNLDYITEGYLRLARGDTKVFAGIAFSVPLLTILLAHEFGHYLACRQWRVKATLPYFLPSPTLLGTLGAFIRIKSPIYTRNILFDIGASGPIAGFLVLLPFLFWGIHWSREVPDIASRGDLSFGIPLLLRIAEAIQFPGVPSRNILIHPIAMGAWAGLIATATNLLPIGQLDGGHILYSVAGERWHRIASNLLVVVLAGLGFLYRPWWILAAILFLFGRRHPLVYDETPVNGPRKLLSIFTLLIFVLSILLMPVEVHIR